MAAQSRKKNTFYNTVVPLFITLITVFLKFFEIRLYLSVLGEAYNGLQSASGQILSYLNIVELGVGAAFTYYLYKPIAEGNVRRMCAVFNGAKIIMRRIGVVFAILLTATAFIYPFFVKDVRAGEFPHLIVSATIIFLGAGTLYGYFISAPESLFLIANQKQFILRILTSVYTLGLPLVSIVVFSIVQGRTDINHSKLYLIILLLKALISLVSSLVVYFYVRKKFPFLNSNKDEKDTSIFTMTKDVLPIRLTNLLIHNTMPIILSVFSSLPIVSIYSIYYLITSYAVMFTGPVMDAPRDSLGNLIVEDEKKFHTIFNRYETISLTFVTISTGMMLMFIYPFFQWYLPDKPHYSIIPMMVIFSFTFYLRMIRMPYENIVSITGSFKQIKWIAVLEGIIILTVAIVGFQIFKSETAHLLVAALSPVVGYIFYDTVQIFIVNTKVLKRNYFVYLKKEILSLIFLAAVNCLFYLTLPIMQSIRWNFLAVFCYGCLLLLTIGLPSVIVILYFRKKHH